MKKDTKIEISAADKKVFNTLQKQLQIESIKLLKSKTDIKQSFLENGGISKSNSREQILSTPKELLVKEVVRNKKKQKYLEIYYKFGLRFVTSDEHENVLAKIEGDYLVRYTLIPGAKLTKKEDVLALFAETNVPHNLWPFWREHVNTTFHKAGLSSIVLPLYHSQQA